MTLPGILERPMVDDGQTSGYAGWIVTVYNNDYNTVDEVVGILMAATGCSLDEACMETWEVDNLGKSVVHQATKGECDRAAGIIGRIGIRVQVSEG